MEDNLQISDNPRKLPFKLIKKITNDFSKDRILGRGAFGTVYKGVNEDGEHIAVKVLHFLPGIDDQQFQNEFDNMKRLEHPNIVLLVGFCDETEEAVAMHEGRWVNCEKIHRALCLEYVTNGSLGKLLLSGKLLGKSWPTRYKIIKGICEGLKYLHEGLDDPIFHFDLKLDNILLDEEMLPKIADFGLSRLLGEENTKRTITPLGTFGYLPPEFITNQIISKEYDIFSLGVVIKKIITCGIVDSDMDAQEFIEHVHDNWTRNLQEEVPRCSLPDADCKHAKRCMELAVNCMQYDRRKRPTMNEVVSKLKEIEKTSTAATLVPSILGHQPEPVKTLEMDTARPFSNSSPRRQAAPLSSSPMHHGHGHDPRSSAWPPRGSLRARAWTTAAAGATRRASTPSATAARRRCPTTWRRRSRPRRECGGAATARDARARLDGTRAVAERAAAAARDAWARPHLILHGRRGEDAALVPGGASAAEPELQVVGAAVDSVVVVRGEPARPDRSVGAPHQLAAA